MIWATLANIETDTESISSTYMKSSASWANNWMNTGCKTVENVAGAKFRITWIMNFFAT